MSPIDPTLHTLAADPNALAALKQRALTDERGAALAAAKQFEALLLEMMLNSMRDTVGEGLLDNEGTRLFTGLLDQQFARSIAQRGGLGLAELLVNQLTQLRTGGQESARSADNRITERGAS